MIGFIYSYKLELKGLVEITEPLEIERSCVQERYSTLELLLLDEFIIEQKDFIKIEHNGNILWGCLMEVDYDYHNNEIYDVTVGFGSDMLDLPMYIDSSFEKPNIFEYMRTEFLDKYQNTLPIRIKGNGSGYIIAPDRFLPFSQSIRQLLRQNYEESVYYENGYIVIEFSYNSEIKQINLEDTIGCEISFSRDNINSVVAYRKAEDEETDSRFFQMAKRYLTQDGQITADINQAIKPLSMLELIYTYDEYSIEKVEIELRNLSYNNNIEIQISKDYIYNNIIYKDVFKTLGKKIDIFLNGKFLPSVVNEIKIEDEIITIVFGQGSTRLFDRL